MSSSFSARRWIAALQMLACLWLAGTPQVLGANPAESRRSLAEALEELRESGLKLVYTTQLVRPEMYVMKEPAALEALPRLTELLRPHGLTWKQGAGETIVVVAGEQDAAPTPLRGVVRSRMSGAPVSGARVVVIGTDLEAVTSAAGEFELADPEVPDYDLEVRRRGFVVMRVSSLDEELRSSEPVALFLDTAPVLEDELRVTPSRISFLRDEPVTRLDISRDDIRALPHLGGDIFRALSLLPGIAANDVSAQFHIRGGRRDETRILLDGQELYEVYHLQDFDSALSVVAPTTLENVDMMTGGFPAEHGDRMSGVLDMTTLIPKESISGFVGLGLLNAEAGGAGRFASERGSWLFQARRGSIDLAGRLLGNEDPQYWDAFAKLDFELTPSSRLRGNLLYASDQLTFSELIDGETKLIETDYASSYAWLTHTSTVGSTALVESAISASRIDRDRFAVELEDDVQFTIDDLRLLDVLALRQSWQIQPGPRHFIKAGFEFRRFDTDFDYTGSFSFQNPLARIRELGVEDSLRFKQSFKEDHISLHLADRVRLTTAFSLEAGVRWDRHTQTDESLVSPRLNLAYSAGSRTLLRAAWGRFTQSQRPYELQVEDGETQFFQVERSESRVLGFEHIFGNVAKGTDITLRTEAFQRDIKNPRPRFESLYEPVNTFPEVEPDRVRIAPIRSRSEGLEVMLRGRLGERTGWWMNYSLSATEDDLGGVTVPRSFDQTHALNMDVDYQFGPHWRLNLAWRFHTGWPTTPLSFREELAELEEIDPEDTDGEEGPEVDFVPVLGRLFSERLSNYHRLDFRASREWESRYGHFTFYVDLQNVYDRRNVAGFDIVLDDEQNVIVRTAEEWAGFLPSVGISLRF